MGVDSNSDDEGLSDTAKGYRAAAPYLSAAWRFVGGCVVGVVGGHYLDRWLHIAPWGTVGLSFIGIGVGFYGMMLALNDLNKANKKKAK